MKVTIKQTGFDDNVRKLRLYRSTQVTGEGYSIVLRRTGFLTFSLTLLLSGESRESADG